MAGVAVSVHLAVLAAALALGQTFLAAQTLAAVAVLVGGMIADAMFMGGLRAGRLISLVGWGLIRLLANVAVADLAWREGARWWLAGLAGAAVGAMWTYADSDR